MSARRYCDICKTYHEPNDCGAFRTMATLTGSTAMAAEIASLRSEVETLRAENESLRALNEMTGEQCIACGGTKGHWDGCHGTAALAAIVAERDRYRRELEEERAKRVAVEAERDRLSTLINNPHTTDFLEAVRLEASHQRERWGTEHDEGKTDADWFWLTGHLASKALMSAKRADEDWRNNPAASYPHDEKALHHIITTAAALLNWHAARTGFDTRMRPGISLPHPPGEKP